MRTAQVKDLCYGLYGKTAVPINPEVQKKALKDYPRGEEPITCRPAEVLEPELEKAQEEIKDLAKDLDDVAVIVVQFGLKHANRRGLFDAANGGSILLDEISELPAAMQVKLLRVIQERSIRRVGDDEEHTVDVRLIAATNRDLQALVKEGGFREDLFYRLNVVRVRVPPLRERVEDIPLLAREFVRIYAAQAEKEITDISDESLRALTALTVGTPYPLRSSAMARRV